MDPTSLLSVNETCIRHHPLSYCASGHEILLIPEILPCPARKCFARRRGACTNRTMTICIDSGLIKQVKTSSRESIIELLTSDEYRSLTAAQKTRHIFEHLNAARIAESEIILCLQERLVDLIRFRQIAHHGEFLVNL